ncbi:HK97-gp10 family putative phage morphogenesis protein [Falsirhodobacter halotolerans]|uniref:HK97-gp10 family putative phage morphogenesis protein n=1 Tax=Falsirhodobacter halotolerans TaxID=1146892 RepID=UPI001FD02A6B|nr:HK97-gp10 family putative phage morphogenesis protein [Falsirhodobacter halotolerans]MCJ8138430.1 HK97 gp10 family phage protein [Falsirhodobacter halotolerans]
MTFRIDGDKALMHALQQIGRRSTQIAVTRRALQKAAEPMRVKAEQYAPIGPTGNLSSGIKISVRAKGEVGRAAYAATMRETGGDKAAAVAALRTARRTFRALNPPAMLYLGPVQALFYAHFVEFGTRPHPNKGRFTGTQHPGTAPDPFLRPAFDEEAQATIARVARLIWTEIEKNATRTARRRARAGGS